MKSISSCVARSLKPPSRGSPAATLRCAPNDRDRTPVRDAAQKRGPPPSSPPSSTPPAGIACTRRCISPRPPGCAAARSPGCGGATGTLACISCRSAVPAKHSLDGPRSSPPRPAPVDAASNSTPTPKTSSTDGAIVNAAMGTALERATRCSPTPAENRCTRNRSASCSPGSSSVRDYLTSGFTTCSTPTPACSSPPASR